jgi:hypothetical protein
MMIVLVNTQCFIFGVKFFDRRRFKTENAARITLVRLFYREFWIRSWRQVVGEYHKP